jgi:hypothetical protein
MLRAFAILCALSAGALFGQSATKAASHDGDLLLKPGQSFTVPFELSEPIPNSVVEAHESYSNTINGPTLDAPPYVFHLTIPPGTKPGRYAIDVTVRQEGYAVGKDRLWVDVEIPASPRTITVPGGPLILRHGASGLWVKGTFDDYGEIDLTGSTRTSFEVWPPGVVSLLEPGPIVEVRARKPGTATITVHYENMESSFKVVVPEDNLQITSPSERSIVHPGETIPVEVSATGGPFELVGVEGPGMDGCCSPGSNSKSYQLSLTIASAAQPGLARLTAIGKIADDVILLSGISLDIERADPPQSILTTSEPQGLLIFMPIGVEEPIPHGIRLYGKYPDDSLVNLTNSTYTTFESSDEKIVSVDKDGYAKGLAVGKTTILVHHRDQTAVVKVVVMAGER